MKVRQLRRKLKNIDPEAEILFVGPGVRFEMERRPLSKEALPTTRLGEAVLPVEHIITDAGLQADGKRYVVLTGSLDED